MRMTNDRWLFVIVILILVIIPSPVHAVRTLSDSQVTISSPIDDDVFVSGGTVNINSPVSGLVVAGGTININAPVSGDVIATGGQIFVNSDVGGKIVAIGGKIDLLGSAKNVVLLGGTIRIHPSAVVSKDALIGGSDVNNGGTIKGNLTVMTQHFVNTGSAGNVTLKKSDILQEFQQRATVAEIVIIGGFFILGIILIKYFPSQFMKVEERVRRPIVKTTIVGFVAIIVSVVVIVLTAITVIGLPIAAIMAMFFIVALMLSTLFVSFSFGKKIVDKLNFKTNNYGIFTIGFFALNLLFKIPFAGPIILTMIVSLGFGAIYYTVRSSWKS
jgi:hypothetical protein